MRSRLVRLGALAVGTVLFLAALYYINIDLAVGTVRRLGPALPVALLFSGLWHLARTWAWAWCFPEGRTVGFLRLARVRLAAEAFSYLTLRGIAGEPLKVVLLSDRVSARDAAAAVALERLAYMIVTTLIVGVGSVAALTGLSLSPPWSSVFRAFAIGAAVVGFLTAVVICGRGTYLQALLPGIDRRLGTRIADGRISRFALAIEAQVLELVRGNPWRLVVLLTATVLSYLFMGLEAWIILRASGTAITANGALAVETFSRVASFASAFIPANLGALEASSLAAVAAIGAMTGGAALAVARRLRGLFWAGIGLAIYPRSARVQEASQDEMRASRPVPSRPTIVYLPEDRSRGVPHATRLAGLPIAERVMRAAARAGYVRIIVWTADVGRQTRKLLQRLSRSVPGVVLVSSDHEWSIELRDRPSPYVTAVGAGTVVSSALLESAGAIRPAPGEVTDVPAAADSPESGVLRMSLVDALDRESVRAQLQARVQRNGQLPSGVTVANGAAKLALRIRNRHDLRHAEATIRRASYKDTDNKLAQFNRRISLPISIVLMRTPITPNQVSVLLMGVGLYSAWLFSMGQYWTGVLAAALSLAASILDGCDGEIARLKYQESALGCWIETFADYAYYIAIFTGLTVGAVRQTRIEAFYWIGGLALAGTLLSFAFLIYLRTRITGGRPERLHAIAGERFQSEPTLWSRLIWRVSFTATRSAMPYGILAFALAYALPAIVFLAALGANIYWLSLAVKLRSLLGDDETVPA